MLANDEVCQSAYGLLSRIGSYGSIRIPLSMSLCIHNNIFNKERQSMPVALGDELASRSIVDA